MSTPREPDATTPEELRTRLEELERRLAALEAHVAWHLGPVAGTPTPAAAANADASAAEGVNALVLAGRSLVVLGGAYLLRALTEGELLPRPLGVLFGLGYAVLWALAADRAAARDKTTSALFHGATAALIAYPLLWETTVVFRVLAPPTTALLLGALTALLFAVAWRRALAGIAWMAVLGTTGAALLLVASTHAPGPFAALLTAVGVATFWGERRSGAPLAWAAAVVADVAVLALAANAAGPRPELAPLAAAAVELGLFLLYLGSFIVLILARRRPVDAFAAAQSAAVWWIGLAGAGRMVGAGTPFLAGGTLLAAAALYGIAFGAVRREERRRVLYFHGVAFLVLLTGTGLLGAPALFWCVAAVLASGLGSALGRPVLHLQGAFFALAAAVASGLLGEAGTAFLAPATTPWPALSPTSLGALAALTLCLLAPVRGAAAWGRFAELPSLLVLALFVAGAGGLVLRLLVPPLAGTPGAGADAAAVAVLRTAVLAGAAAALAWIGRATPYRVAARLPYPLLVAGAVKLLAEDFPHGRAATLFLSLALYGGALIVAARRGRRARG